MADIVFMEMALSEARNSNQDVPVGAVIVTHTGLVLAKARNSKELHRDPTGHAEMLAIREASRRLGKWSLENCQIYVTLEPCVMCAGAIVAARIPEVIFGARNERVGAGGSRYDILRDQRLGGPVKVTGGVLEAECAGLLTDFFESRRD